MTEKVHVFTLISRALPEDVKDKGIQKREELSKDAWDAGDYVNEVYSHVQEFATKSQCAAWVSVQYDAHGYSASTLSYKATVAQAFRPELRAHYDVLPFSHFAAAKAADDPIAALEYSLDEFAKRGHPISAAKVYAVCVLGEVPAEFNPADYHPDDLDPYENPPDMTMAEIGQGIKKWVDRLLSQLSARKRLQAFELVRMFQKDMQRLITELDDEDKVKVEK